MANAGLVLMTTECEFCYLRSNLTTSCCKRMMRL